MEFSALNYSHLKNSMEAYSGSGGIYHDLYNHDEMLNLEYKEVYS